jgi:hypothetical protein
VSAKSRLIEARAKVAELEVESMYLKETQALKIASEELELKKVLAQARKAEQIYEQASNDDILPIPTSELGTNNSNITFDHPVPTYTSFPPIQRTVSETSTNVNTVHTITSSAKVGTTISGDYISQGLTCPTSVNPRANHEVIGGTPSTLTFVSNLATPSTQSSERTTHNVPTTLFTIHSTPLQVTSPATAGHVCNNQIRPLQYSSPAGIEFVPPYSQCAQENTYYELIDLQRKQTGLSQTIASQQARSLLPAHKPPMFAGDALEFPTFWTAFESLI